MKEEKVLQGEKYLGRKVKQKIIFSVPGTFQSHYAACGWCGENGYSYGSTDIGRYVAVRKGEYDLPQKWKNMTAAERNSVDGVMASHDRREGSVTIYIFN